MKNIHIKSGIYAKIAAYVASVALLAGVAACSAPGEETAGGADSKTIVYSKSFGPYSDLFEDAIVPILEKQGYTVEAKQFSDLLQADVALLDGEVQLNVEQHVAYMEDFNETHKGNLTAITPIPTVPAGIFSNTHQSLDEVAKGQSIAIPNDASNTARAYRLLAQEGLITLNPQADESKYTKKDIQDNPYSLEFTELDSVQIPRVLDDFDFAVLPGSVVANAGIDPNSSLAKEENIPDHLVLQAVVRDEDKDTEWAKAVAEAYHSEEFKEYMDADTSGLWFLPEELR